MLYSVAPSDSLARAHGKIGKIVQSWPTRPSFGGDRARCSRHRRVETSGCRSLQAFECWFTLEVGGVTDHGGAILDRMELTEAVCNYYSLCRACHHVGHYRYPDISDK
jgi:hypothetical protein